MNGLSKDTWVGLWKPEFQNEAGLIYDALAEIHQTVKAQPLKCDKKFLTKTAAVIFILAALAFGEVGLPLLGKVFGF